MLSVLISLCLDLPGVVDAMLNRGVAHGLPSALKETSHPIHSALVNVLSSMLSLGKSCGSSCGPLEGLSEADYKLLANPDFVFTYARMSRHRLRAYAYNWKEGSILFLDPEGKKDYVREAQKHWPSIKSVSLQARSINSTIFDDGHSHGDQPPTTLDEWLPGIRNAAEHINDDSS